MTPFYSNPFQSVNTHEAMKRMSLKCVIRRFITHLLRPSSGTAILQETSTTSHSLSQLIGQLQNHLTYLQCKLIRAKRHELIRVMCIIRNLLITLYVNVKQLKYVPSVFCALQTYKHHPNSRTAIKCLIGAILRVTWIMEPTTFKETGKLAHA